MRHTPAGKTCFLIMNGSQETAFMRRRRWLCEEKIDGTPEAGGAALPLGSGVRYA